MLQKYVSVRDTATKAPLENYYHGFLNGIFTCCENLITDYILTMNQATVIMILPLKQSAIPKL